MTEESKIADPELEKEIVAEASQGQDRNDDTEEAEGGGASAEDVAQDFTEKKKRSKKAKLKKALTGKDASDNSSNPSSKLTSDMVEKLLVMNPSLKGEVAGMDEGKAAEKLKKLDVADMLTGMSVSGKNQKDMASYKFWQTQPVPRFDEQRQTEEGPIKTIDPQKVPKEPPALLEGFEWVTMDLLDERQV
ncbi:MAG: hypothetical protein Q9217_006363 [Psora testacea]